jgi:hypothetical protein
METVVIAIRMILLMVGIAITSHSCASQSMQRESAEAGILKDWALSRCLAKAAKDENFGNDAAKTAAAFLERGTAEMTTYEKVETLIDTFLARRYSGSVKGEYKTMKCIDLYHSRDLDDSIRGE